MFDNPIDDAVPGKPTICGWPWHGRLDMPSALGAIPELTLKNGQVIPLAISLGKPERREWHQHGTVLRFRDPRAVDPIRTPAELAADEARGVSWRADVLYAPREGVLYGQAPTEGRLQTWLYHDGERNWRVRFRSNNSLLLRSQLIVVGRKRPVIAQQVVSVSYPDGVPYMPMMVIIDATSKGDRILFGRYLPENESFGAGSPQFNQEELGAWTTPPFDFWELTLVKDNPEAPVTAVFRIVRTRDEVRPPFPDNHSTVIGAGAVYATVSLETSTTVTTYWGSAKPPVDIWNPVGPLLTWGGREYVINRDYIASLYYEGDAIKEVVFRSECFSRVELTMSGLSFSISYEGEFVGGTFVNGYAKLTGNLVRSTNATLIAKLLRGGVQVSQLTATVASYASQGMVYDCAIGQRGVAALRMTEIESLTERTNFSFDGISIPSQVRSELPYVGGTYTDGPLSDAGNSANVTTVRYSGNMVALAVNVKQEMDPTQVVDSSVAYQYIGNCATPTGVVPVINKKPRLPPLGHLYGSWNPVTKESIRDALNPVFWV